MNLFKDIFTYPVRGGGKYILAIGAILTVGSHLMSFAPLVGGIAGLILFAYFCAMYFKMIESSATGGKEAPEYPDISNFFEDVIWPMLQLVIIGLISFGPLMIYQYEAGMEAQAPIAAALSIFGAVYSPMAVLAVVVLGRISAISPHVVIPAIFRAGWRYLLAVGLLAVISGLESLSEQFIADLFLIKYLVMAVVGMYCLMANARTLGLIFRDRRDELNWI